MITYWRVQPASFVGFDDFLRVLSKHRVSRWLRVTSREREFAAFNVPRADVRAFAAAVADLNKELIDATPLSAHPGDALRLVEEALFRLDQPDEEEGGDTDDEAKTPTTPFDRTGISDVIAGALTGEGATIAVVDSGLAKQVVAQFEGRLQAGYPIEVEGAWSPLDDHLGHGTMVACIAAAKPRVEPGFTGAAPGAGVIVCRLAVNEKKLGPVSDVALALDWLRGQLESGKVKNLVVNCSFGMADRYPPACSPPEDDLVLDAVEKLADAGALIVTSAGNYGAGTDTSGTIWHFKTRSDVVTVGYTGNAIGTPDYVALGSSRGYGAMCAGQPSTNPKPDVVAPAPGSWEVPHLDGVVVAGSWGSSGASPQVAGLAALIWSKDPSLANHEVADIIRRTAVPLVDGTGTPLPDTDQGSGLINAVAALANTRA